MLTRRISLADFAERRIVLDEQLVRRFADVIGDHNPIHLDAAAAAASRFEVPIVHGMLAGSLFSGLIAHELPGPGSVYLSQTLRFRRPVAVGSTVVARVECSAIDGARITLRTVVQDQMGVECVVGEAVVLLA